MQNSPRIRRRELLFGAAIAAGISVTGAKAQTTTNAPNTNIPNEWLDELTGARIKRLSNVDNSRSLYFHDNAFTKDGRYMVMDTPLGIALYDFVEHKNLRLTGAGFSCIMVSRSKNIVYARKYNGAPIGKDNNNIFRGLEYFAIDIPSGNMKSLGVIENGFITSINADDTLMVGTYAHRFVELQPGPKVANTDGGYNAIGPDGKPLSFAAAKEVRMATRLNARVPMEIFTINIATGARRIITASTDWLNHVQFSPTDPRKIMYCHEGPWHMVDRLWTIDTNGRNKQKLHTRTMNMEIAGHEFFAPDGKSIYYDLQTPRGEKFWLAHYDFATKKRIWYHLERNEWSVHFQISLDGKLLAGDGGDNEMVAKAPDGKYIYLFYPELIEDLGVSAPNAADLIRPGRLVAKKLVDMRKHDYRLEPNIHFSPDGKYLVFRSNMHGPTHTYAVELSTIK